MKQHKWHKDIKAWANGAEIEHRVGGERWILCNKPSWGEQTEYRIKPQPKAQYLYVYLNDVGQTVFLQGKARGVYWTFVGKIKLEVDNE